MAADCPLHGLLQRAADIISTTSGVIFPTNQPLSCDIQNVIYVITCWQCLVQGVGESANMKARFLPCIWAASNSASSENSARANENHFRNSPRSLEDLGITLVDANRANKAYASPIVSAMRLRLKHRWIYGLGASLNVCRNRHSSFPGGSPTACVADSPPS